MISVAESTVALKVAGPAVDEVTVKVATPLEPVASGLGKATVSVAPRVEVNSTDTPGIGLLKGSNTVTVTVMGVVPSAGTPPGMAVTVDAAALAAPVSTVKTALNPGNRLSPLARVASSFTPLSALG